MPSSGRHNLQFFPCDVPIVGLVTDWRSAGTVLLGCSCSPLNSDKQGSSVTVIHSSVIPSHSMCTTIHLSTLSVTHLTSPSILRWQLSTSTPNTNTGQEQLAFYSASPTVEGVGCAFILTFDSPHIAFSDFPPREEIWVRSKAVH